MARARREGRSERVMLVAAEAETLSIELTCELYFKIKGETNLLVSRTIGFGVARQVTLHFLISTKNLLP